MKKRYLKNAVALVIGLCLVGISDAASKAKESTDQSASDGGSLVVKRSASVGSGIFVNVSADGKQIAALSNNRIYRGNLSPGKHVISVVGDPNLAGQAPNKMEVNVEKGKTYSFTASLKSGKLVLEKSS
jgi:hypothetical protein